MRDYWQFLFSAWSSTILNNMSWCIFLVQTRICTSFLSVLICTTLCTFLSKNSPQCKKYIVLQYSISLVWVVRGDRGHESQQIQKKSNIFFFHFFFFLNIYVLYHTWYIISIGCLIRERGKVFTFWVSW